MKIKKPSQNVWDEFFKAVYHLSSIEFIDSTNSEFHGSGTGITKNNIIDDIPGKGVYFNTSAKINTNNSNDYITHTIETSLSMSTQQTQDAHILSKNIYFANTNDDFPVVIMINSSNLLSYGLSIGDDYNRDVNLYGGTLQLNTNYYIAASNEISGQSKLYLDGINVDSDSAVSLSTNSNAWTIGQAYSEYGGGVNLSRFDGNISEVRISNIERSNDWIQVTHKSNNDNLIVVDEDNTNTAYHFPIIRNKFDDWDQNNIIQLSISKYLVSEPLYNFPVLLNIGKNSGTTDFDSTIIFDNLGDEVIDVNSSFRNHIDYAKWYFAPKYKKTPSFFNDKLLFWTEKNDYETIISKFMINPSPFDIEIYFDILDGPTGNYWHFSLSIFTYDPQNAIYLTQVYDGSSYYVELSHDSLGTWSSDSIATNITASGLRLVRNENNVVIAYYFDGSTWVSLPQTATSATDIGFVRIYSSTTDSISKINVYDFKLNYGDISGLSGISKNRKKLAVQHVNSGQECFVEISKWYDHLDNNVKLLFNEVNKTDDSLSEHPITVNGNPSTHDFNYYPELNNSIFINASDKYIIINDHADFQYSTNPLTIEFFVNFYTVSNSSYIMSKCTLGGSYPGWYICLYNSKIIFNTNNNVTAIQSNSTFSIDKWYHIAITYDGTNISLWIDGLLDATSPLSSIQNVNEDLKIGNLSSTYISNCHLSKIRLSNNCRYTQNFTLSLPYDIDDNTVLQLDFNEIQYHGEIIDIFIDSTHRHTPINYNNNISCCKFEWDKNIKFDGTIDNIDCVSMNVDDNFSDGINEKLWTVNNAARVTNEKLVLGVNDSIISKYAIKGDCDIQVDFDTANTVDANSWGLNLYAIIDDNNHIHCSIGHTNTVCGSDARAYFGYAKIAGTSSEIGCLLTNDTTGKLRITRSGSDFSIYKWNGTNWDAIKTSQNISDADFHVKLSLDSWDTAPIAECSMDNFIVNSGYAFFSSSDWSTKKQPFSIECWMRRYGANITNHMGIFHYEDIDNTEGIHFNIYQTQLHTYVRGNGFSYQQYNQGPVITDGNWHHIVLSFDGTTLSNYVDGQQLQTTTVDPNFSIENTFFVDIGKNRYDGTIQSYDGFLCNLKFVKNSIAYTSNYTPPEYYTLVRKQSAQLYLRIPEISNTEDTILKLYYDSNQSDNTDFVNDTGASITNKVWVNGYEHVYHLNTARVCDSAGTSAINGNITYDDVIDGHIGKAIHFNGNNTYLKTDNSDYSISSSWTIEAKCKWNRVTGNNTICCQLGSSGANNGIALMKSDSSSEKYVVGSTGNNTEIDISVISDRWNAYANISSIIDAGICNFYIDSSIANKWHALSIGDISNTLFSIGSDSNNANNTSIDIEEVRLSRVNRSFDWQLLTVLSNYDELINWNNQIFDWNPLQKITYYSNSIYIDETLYDFPVKLIIDESRARILFDKIGHSIRNMMILSNNEPCYTEISDVGTAVYPSSYDSTHVKATSYFDSRYYPFNAVNPDLSITGDMGNDVAWLAANTQHTNQKFNVDLGTIHYINLIKLVNQYHQTNTENYVNSGIKNFIVYGTNDATAFNNTDYYNIDNLTELGRYQAKPHSLVDRPHYQYFYIDTDLAFRYYILRIIDDHGGGAEAVGFRHIEFIDLNHLELWIKVPKLSHNINTQIDIYYDETKKPNLQYVGYTGSPAAKHVWDNNYLAVYHMNDNCAHGYLLDSSNKMRHGTIYGSMLRTNTIRTNEGNHIIFDGVDDYVSLPSIQTGDIDTKYTFEMTITPISIQNNDGILVLNNTGFVYRLVEKLIAIENNDAVLQDNTAFASMNTQTYITYRRSDSTYQLADDLNWTSIPLNNNGWNIIDSIALGYQNIYANIQISEIRISNTARSDAWLRASKYNDKNMLLTVYTTSDMSIDWYTTLSIDWYTTLSIKFI